MSEPAEMPPLYDTPEGGLRVGFFSESFHPVQNGVTTSMLTLMSGLREHGHHVFVFAPEHQKGEPQAHVVRFPSFVSSWNPDNPMAYPFLPRIALATRFNRLKLDIVHTHTPFVMGTTGQKLALRRGIPLVTTFHTLYSQYGHYVPFLPDAVTQGLIEHYLPRYYNRCAQIMCPSQTAKNALREWGVQRPVEVVPTGIPLPDADAISPRACAGRRRELGLNSDTPLLLYAGRLAPEKNVEWLLDVFGLIRKEVSDAVLLIAGPGPHTEELQRYAAQHVWGEHVRFLGPVARRRMDTLYACADVFCFPSPTETQGLVIGEARACGTPSVVVDAGGAPETVCEGEDGFRVPVDAPHLFARRVVRLLQNPDLRERMRVSCLQNALRYTPERMVERVLTVYQRAQASGNDAAWNDGDGEETTWEAVGQSVLEKPFAEESARNLLPRLPS